MRKFFLLLSILCGLSAFGQTKIRDIYAEAPDSVFPLLTKNNRLDCLDFMENKMQAKVKNKLDQRCEMTALTDRYLSVEMSEKSRVEMLLLNDSLFCMIRTYKGPAEDSQLTFYKRDWTPVEIEAPHPAVKDFWTKVPDSLKQDAQYAQGSLRDLTLIGITVSPDDLTLTYTLQTSELVDKEKEAAQQCVKPLQYRWEDKRFSLVSKR